MPNTPARIGKTFASRVIFAWDDYATGEPENKHPKTINELLLREKTRIAGYPFRNLAVPTRAWKRYLTKRPARCTRPVVIS